MAASGESRKLADLKVIELRAELEKRGLDKNGVKAVLYDRLQQSLKDNDDDPADYVFEAESSPKKTVGGSAKKATRTQDVELDEDKEDDDADALDDTVYIELDDAEGATVISEDPVGGGDVTDSATKDKELPVAEEKMDTNTDDVTSLTKQQKSPASTDVVTSPAKQQKTPAGTTGVTSPTKQQTTPDAVKTTKGKDIVKSLVPRKNIGSTGGLVKVDNLPATPTRDAPKENQLTVEDTIKMDTSVARQGDDNMSLVVHVDDDATNDLDADLESGDTLNSTITDDKSMSESSVGNSKSPGAHNSIKSTTLSPGGKGTAAADEATKKGEDKAGNTAAKSSDSAKTTTGSKDDQNRNLWISGLAKSTRATDLKTLFSKHGKVVGAKVVTNARHPGSRCYGFVTMATVEESKKCIQHLNRTELHGRIISIEKAKNDPGSAASKVSAAKKAEEKNTTEKKVVPESGDTQTKQEDQKGDPLKSPVQTLSKNAEKKLTPNKPRPADAAASQSQSSPAKKDRVPFPSRKDNAVKVSTTSPKVQDKPSGQNVNVHPKKEVLSFDKIKEERERERLRQKERDLREIERMHLRETDRERKRQKEIFNQQRREQSRLEMEREELRIERQRLQNERMEVQRQDQFRRERERKERERLEKEKLEHERELERVKLEAERRSVKRSMSSRDDSYHTVAKRPMMNRDDRFHGDAKRTQTSRNDGYRSDGKRTTSQRPDSHQKVAQNRVKEDRYESHSRGADRHTDQSSSANRSNERPVRRNFSNNGQQGQTSRDGRANVQPSKYVERKTSQPRRDPDQGILEDPQPVYRDTREIRDNRNVEPAHRLVSRDNRSLMDEVVVDRRPAMQDNRDVVVERLSNSRDDRHYPGERYGNMRDDLRGAVVRDTRRMDVDSVEVIHDNRRMEVDRLPPAIVDRRMDTNNDRLERYETRVIRDDGHLRRDSGAREHRVNLHEVNVRDNVGANIARQTNSWKAMQTVQRADTRNVIADTPRVVQSRPVSDGLARDSWNSGGDKQIDRSSGRMFNSSSIPTLTSGGSGGSQMVARQPWGSHATPVNVTRQVGGGGMLSQQNRGPYGGTQQVSSSGNMYMNQNSQPQQVVVQQPLNVRQQEERFDAYNMRRF